MTAPITPRDVARRARAVLAQQRYRQRWPERARAQSAAQSARRRGKLVPGPCEVCGADLVEAHHHDYAAPLDVAWLCPRHHREEHARLRRERGAGQVMH